VSAQKPSGAQQPYRFKSKAARLGPVYRWARRLRAGGRFIAKRPHDPDFAAFERVPVDGLFLDVGASIGQSALSFRIYNRDAPVLSLEPLPSHRGDLRFVRRIIGDHEFLMVGAAAESRQETIYVPKLDSFALPARSSLNRADAAEALSELEAEGTDPDRLHLEELAVELRRIDELGVDPAFVKIDVEGAELGVLEGMVETIARCRPPMMIERSEHTPEAIGLLAAHGYSPQVYEQGTGTFTPYDGQEVYNLFFFPGDPL
jgi:FkbM family methyltransferase